MADKRGKKVEKKPALAPEELAKRISEAAGLLPDEIHKLLDSLAKVETNRIVYHKKTPGAKLTHKNRYTLKEAIEIELRRIRQRREREEKLREYLRKKYKKPVEFESREVIADDEYPQRLSPFDIGYSIETVRKNVLEEEKSREGKTEFHKRSEIILDALLRLRLNEAARVARMIAARQKLLGEHALEDAERGAVDSDSAVEQERQNVEEIRERIRMLQSFGKNNMNLIDEAKDVVETDYDSAASVMKQWIGNVRETQE